MVNEQMPSQALGQVRDDRLQSTVWGTADGRVQSRVWTDDPEKMHATKDDIEEHPEMAQEESVKEEPEEGDGECKIVVVTAKKRRRGSFFKIGGLVRKVKTVVVKEVTATQKPSLHGAKPRKSAGKERVHPVVAPEPVYCDKETLRCTLCNVSFPNVAKMSTHLKFSTLHELNLKSGKKIPQLPVNVENDPVIPVLRYRGCKYIVRFNVKLDVYVFEQEATENRPYRRLAVICYNMDKEEEYPPIYLNASLVEMHATQLRKTQSYLNEANNVMKLGTDKKENETTAAVMDKSEVVGEFAMSRISYAEPGGVSMKKNACDTYDSITVPGPASLPGVHIERKRRQSIAEEFATAEHELEMEQKKLHEARMKAQKLANQACVSMNEYNKRFHPQERLASQHRIGFTSSRIFSKKITESLASQFKRIGSKFFGGVASPRENASVLSTPVQ